MDVGFHPKRRRHPNDYTAACICPMGLELAPVEAMLDEIHEAIPTSHGQNAYTLGHIGEHNVVVAIMPEIGTNTAASVATQLLIDFPAVRFCLLVGIGGGVPGKVDVRLGDVVVSQPTNSSGGVVQYDMEKSLEGGRFQPTGSVNKPPQIISASVRKLDAQHRRLGNELSQHITDMISRYPAMSAEYSFPATEPDQLFLSTYTHQTGLSCENCHPQTTVIRKPRPERSPQVHYGLIGSANVVVKDAQLRDALQEDMHILCVEMEAAGLMSNYPCLVVRGICDYADSHKNKMWQPYAAAVAAVYMKALMLVTAALSVPHQNLVVESATSTFAPGLDLRQAPVLESNLFIGRSAEIQAMQDFLKPAGRQQEHRRLVLGGMGGIGKSQLAIAYAKQQSQQYQSIFWLNATSEVELKRSFRQVAQRFLDINEYGLLDDEQVLLHISRWLLDVGNSRWLLIFDNYDEPRSFDIQKYCPYGPHGSVIITSRLPDQVTGHKFLVEPLKETKHGIQILETRSGRMDVATDPHAHRLADRMHGLPLALATAGTYLRHSTWTFEKYLHEYETRWDVSPRRPVQLLEYENRTLQTAWNLSYHYLRETDADAARLLKLLAHYDNQCMWYELVQAGLNNNSPEWLRNTIVDDFELAGTIRTLAEHCFVKVQYPTGSWSMHECIRDWTLAQLNKPLDPQCYWFMFDSVVASIAALDYRSLDHTQYAKLVPHALRLTDPKLQQIGDELPEDRCDQAMSIADFLAAQMQWDSAETMYVRVLTSAGKILEADHPKTLRVTLSLGKLYHSQSKLIQASQMLHRARVGFKRRFGAEHEMTLHASLCLGELYYSQGNFDKAKHIYQRVYTRCEKLFGADHLSTLSAVHNLAELYLRQGKLKSAREMFERVRAGYEKQLGNDHSSTIDVILCLAELCHSQYMVTEAEQMYQEVQTFYERKLGVDHPSTLRAVVGLGELYHDTNRHSEAEQMYHRALVGHEKRLGTAQPMILRTILDLGELYHSEGQPDKEEKMFQRVKEQIRHEEKLGTIHLSTLNAMFFIGELHYSWQRYEEAEQDLQSVVSGRTRVLGHDHADTLEAVDFLNTVRSAHDLRAAKTTGDPSGSRVRGSSEF